MARALALDTPAPAPIRVRSRVAPSLVRADPVPNERAVIGNNNPPSAVTEEMKALAHEVFTQNEAMNAAKRKAEAAKKKLYAMMEQAGVQAGVEVMCGTTPVEAVIETATGNKVSNEKLIDAVGQDGFLKVASATQDAIKKEFGDNMLMKCLVETKAEPALKVRKKK